MDLINFHSSRMRATFVYLMVALTQNLQQLSNMKACSFSLFYIYSGPVGKIFILFVFCKKEWKDFCFWKVCLTDFWKLELGFVPRIWLLGFKRIGPSPPTLASFIALVDENPLINHLLSCKSKYGSTIWIELKRSTMAWLNYDVLNVFSDVLD